MYMFICFLSKIALLKNVHENFCSYYNGHWHKYLKWIYHFFFQYKTITILLQIIPVLTILYIFFCLQILQLDTDRRRCIWNVYLEGKARIIRTVQLKH